MSNQSNQQSRVVVVGAGGKIGYLVAQQLLNEGYTVRATARQSAQVEQLRLAGLTDTTLLDLAEADTAQMVEILQGAKAVICSIGVRPPWNQERVNAVEIEGFGKLVEAARQARIEQFLMVSSIGATRPETIPFLTPVLIAKRQAEIGLENSGLAYTIIRPGGLTDEPGGLPVLVGRGDQTNGRISRADVSTVLIEALRQPSARNQVLEVVNDPQAKKPTDPQFFV